VPVLLQSLLLKIPEVVETERLALQATRPGRGAAISAARAESQAELERWMPWAREPGSPEDAERHCREMQVKWHAREELDFCFVRKSDGTLVGKGGLHTIDWSVPKFEIGYWIRTSCSRQGIATEATLGLVAFATNSLGAHRIEITSDTRNGPSRRVAEKSGFVLEGIRQRSRRDVAGELADSCMYARTF
jgi:RimJ/RimL family protein N-acetyltransferase